MTDVQPLAQCVFLALADGGQHSGQQLAASLGVSRSAIWKAVGLLQRLGMSIDAVTRRGYRLKQPASPLDAERVHSLLPASVRPLVRNGAAVWTLASTNASLLAVGDLPPGRYDFLLAEFQLAGRGRRARPWFAPPGGGICLSLSRQFALLPADFGALSLAIGLAVRSALLRLRPLPVQLKWPNDLVVADRKLGGILIEMRAEAAGPAYVVIGVGLNVSLGAALEQAVTATGTQPTDLATLGWRDCDRNLLAATLIGTLVETVERFEQQGFAAFAAQWRDADSLEGRAVTIIGAGATVDGVALGIAPDGALRVRVDGDERRFVSGEVSVRPVT